MLSILPSRIGPSRRKSSTGPAVPIAEAVVAEARVAFLNQSLDTLREIFPGTAADEFRRLLLESSEESRLHVATEMLLRSSLDRSGTYGRSGVGQLEPWEKFRSEEYQLASQKLL